MKKCKKCEESKNVEEFNKWFKKSGRNGLRTYCKSCESLINKTYREENKSILKIKRKQRDNLKRKNIKKIKKMVEKKPTLRSSKAGLRKDGYVVISRRTHPNSMKDGRILEHVLVMSQHLDRPLKKHENVHHKNGNRSDNRLENLELWSKSQPSGQRLEDKIIWAKELLQENGFEVIKL